MSRKEPWYFTNNYAADTFCPICDKPNHKHWFWCPHVNLNTSYAWAITTTAQLVTPEDKIHLHGMGVIWK